MQREKPFGHLERDRGRHLKLRPVDDRVDHDGTVVREGGTNPFLYLVRGARDLATRHLTLERSDRLAIPEFAALEHFSPHEWRLCVGVRGRRSSRAQLCRDHGDVPALETGAGQLVF